MADFETTLTADLTTSDEVIAVADNTGARSTYPWRLLIEDELVYVIRGVAEGLVWDVLRAADDTDAAEHLAGTIVSSAPFGRGHLTPMTVFISGQDLLPPMTVYDPGISDYLPLVDGNGNQIMAGNPATGNYFPLVDGGGNQIMAEV
jgi:hypothetical protein